MKKIAKKKLQKIKKSWKKIHMREYPKRRIGVCKKTFTLSKERLCMNVFVRTERAFLEVIWVIFMFFNIRIEECTRFLLKIQGIFCDLARVQKTVYIFLRYVVVLHRPPIDLYITYSVYWGLIKWDVKMIDFQRGNELDAIVPRSSLKSRDDQGTIA